jgi:predicted transcriptional regulator
MKTVTVKVPDDWVNSLDSLAEDHDTSRAAVLRSAIDDGLRAHKYYPDEFALNPEEYEEPDAVELAKDGVLPR